MTTIDHLLELTKMIQFMKDFDLEAAKKGAAVCTRDGRAARIICFDRKAAKEPIVALVHNTIDEDSSEFCVTYRENGRYFPKDESAKDLMMVTTKRSGYVKIGYELGVPTAFCEIMDSPDDFVRELKQTERIAKIEWEE